MSVFDKYPGTASGLRFAAHRQDPTFMIAQVTKVDVIAGRVYVDCQNLEHGVYYYAVPVMAQGGDPDNFSSFPTPKSSNEPAPSVEDPIAEAILVLRPGGKPFVIGYKQPIGANITDQTEEDPGQADHGGAISKNDVALRNGGSFFLIDSNGAVTLDVKASKKRVRFQLDEDEGIFRVSRGGQASEKLLLADATVEYLGKIEDQIDEMRTRISLLESSVNSLIGVLTSTGLTVNPTDATAKAAPGTIPAPGSATLNPPYDPVDGRVVSSTVEISDRSTDDG